MGLLNNKNGMYINSNYAISNEGGESSRQAQLKGFNGV